MSSKKFRKKHRIFYKQNRRDMNDLIVKQVGARLQLIRERLNLLQKDMAKALDISGPNLSELEAGNAKPRFEVLVNLSSKFNVNLYFLLHGEGPMFRERWFEGGDSPELSREQQEFLAEFLDFFRRSKVVRYSVMAFFTTYRLKNQRLIRQDMEAADSAGSSTDDHQPGNGGEDS
jgi:transcriptional regulator with XRE-family HTH domain